MFVFRTGTQHSQPTVDTRNRLYPRVMVVNDTVEMSSTVLCCAMKQYCVRVRCQCNYCPCAVYRVFTTTVSITVSMIRPCCTTRDAR